MVIKESYEGEYENRQHACEAGMESWKEGRRKVLLHLRQCQAKLASLQEDNYRLREENEWLRKESVQIIKNLSAELFIRMSPIGRKFNKLLFIADKFVEALNAEQEGEATNADED